MFLKRPYQFILSAAVLGTLLITACSSEGEATSRNEQPTPTNSVKEEPVEQGLINTPVIPPLETQEWGVDQFRIDSQGAVEITVTPVNLDNPGETIEFEVSLNTHSVDLSMDLTELALLSTDTGLSTEAILWDAPLGGHHVEGKLSFPTTVRGDSIIEGVNEVRLIISNLDAPERVFVWQVHR